MTVGEICSQVKPLPQSPPPPPPPPPQRGVGADQGRRLLCTCSCGARVERCEGGAEIWRAAAADRSRGELPVAAVAVVGRLRRAVHHRQALRRRGQLQVSSHQVRHQVPPPPPGRGSSVTGRAGSPGSGAACGDFPASFKRLDVCARAHHAYIRSLPRSLVRSHARTHARA